MIERLREALRRFGSSSESSTQNLTAIAAATLLLEVAWADHHIADEELRSIRRSLTKLFDLDLQTIDTIIEDARARQDESVGLFSFTRTITEAWDEPDRFQLVVAMWELALEDESLHRFEEHMIRRIAELLYVDHPRFIEAKQIARARRESRPD